jgi:hypothetical protein
MKALNFLRLVTGVNLMVSAGFSIAGALKPSFIIPTNIQVNSGTIVFALYGAARTIPLAIIGLFAILSNADSRTILFLGVLAAVIQFTDGFIGIYQKDITKSIGPFLLALLTFIAIYMNRIIYKNIAKA